MRDTHELIVTGFCVRAVTHVSITGPMRVASREFFLLLFYSFILFLPHFFIFFPCFFLFSFLHVGFVLSNTHNARWPGVLEEYQATILTGPAWSRFIRTRARRRDDTPQWLTASVITSFNFHTFSFLSQCTYPHDSEHLHKRGRYNNIIYILSR